MALSVFKGVHKQGQIRWTLRFAKLFTKRNPANKLLANTTSVVSKIIMVFGCISRWACTFYTEAIAPLNNKVNLTLTPFT